MYIYIYIYIEREREREVCRRSPGEILRAGAAGRQRSATGGSGVAEKELPADHMCVKVYIYIYIYICMYIHKIVYNRRYCIGLYNNGNLRRCRKDQKGGYGWKTSSSSNFSIRAFRAFCFIEIRQTIISSSNSSRRYLSHQCRFGSTCT